MEHRFVGQNEPEDGLTVDEFSENLHVHTNWGYEFWHKKPKALLLQLEGVGVILDDFKSEGAD